MRIAITADLHLTTRNRNPERFNGLTNILNKLLDLEIETLIVAGDLFDEAIHNYVEFDALCDQTNYRKIRIVVIPGNHDFLLNQKFFTAQNVQVVSQPTLIHFDEDGLKFLLLPYVMNKTMGEFIAEKSSKLPTNRWVLIGHGDWTERMNKPNPYEPGVYMPLTKIDVENFKPTRVILGHVHRPIDIGILHNPGSPCGLDIRETGRRRFLIIDSQSGTIKSEPVDSDFIFFNEVVTVLPIEDEIEQITKDVERRIEKWQLSESEIPKVSVQVKVRGFSSNKRKLMQAIKEGFKKFQFYKDHEPDLSE